MKKNTALMILFLLLLTVLLGYNFIFQPFSFTNDNQDLSTELTDQNKDTQEELFYGFSNVQDFADSLTPEQKISQLLLLPVSLEATLEASASSELASDWRETLALVEQLQPAGITIFGSKLEYQDTKTNIDNLKQKFKVAPILAVDHEGGEVQRLNGAGFSELPSWRDQCSLEFTKMQVLWQQSAMELSQVGVNMVLAPMLDFATKNSVLGPRICSGDVQKVETFALGYAERFNDNGIQPVFKHFPGIGKTQVDLHQEFDTVSIGTQEADLYINVVQAQKNQTSAIMVGHVGVENQFADISCSLSEACINEIVAIDPKILLISDALEMKSATRDNTLLVETMERAIRAGNHLLVFGPDVDVSELASNTQKLASKYSSSLTFKIAVDKAVARVLEYKYSMIKNEDLNQDLNNNQETPNEQTQSKN
jgi:beta-N-acetylhexosaminidase